MSQDKLRAVVIGAGALGGHILEALGQCSLVELVGLADRDHRAAEALAGDVCPAYADDRQALVETRPDVLFLAVPPRAAAEILQLAAHRDLHVWTAGPPACDLPQAVEMCRQTRAADIKFAVGAPRRFTASYRRALELAGELGEIYLINGRYVFDWGASLGWRGSMASGGGATLQLGYHMMDLVVAIAGVPETVYCVTSTGQRARGGDDQAIYDTDDTSVAICRYRGQTVANVTVSRCFSPVDERLTVFGEGGSIVATPDRCVLRDRDGVVAESLEQDDSAAAVLARQAEDFARAVSEWRERYECSGWESLRTMAVIEAAYLSVRTGQPESPQTLLAGYDLTAADCLAFAPGREGDDEAK